MVREPRSLSANRTSSRACSFAHWCSLIVYLAPPVAPPQQHAGKKTQFFELAHSEETNKAFGVFGNESTNRSSDGSSSASHTQPASQSDSPSVRERESARARESERARERARERERERERERKKERQTDRERQRETESQRSFTLENLAHTGGSRHGVL